VYLCGPGKHSCQPFCGPEGRFYCSDSVCSLWPAPFSYLCVSEWGLHVCWKLSAAEQVKPDCCHTPAVVSTLLTPLPVSCPLTTPHHYICFEGSEKYCIESFLEKWNMSMNIFSRKINRNECESRPYCRGWMQVIYIKNKIKKRITTMYLKSLEK